MGTGDPNLNFLDCQNASNCLISEKKIRGASPPSPPGAVPPNPRCPLTERWSRYACLARRCNPPKFPAGRKSETIWQWASAIQAACSYLLSTPSLPFSLHIFSDSQAALRSLTSTVTQSHLVSDIVALLNKLGALTALHLHWVPGHSDILGNDRADLLANRGSDHRPIGPEPFTPFSSSHVINSTSFAAT